MTDTGVDDLGPARGGDPRRAGRGLEVVVACGALKVRYAHLRRGTGRPGDVRVGRPVGFSGTTGRCVDGAGRAFVHVEARRGSTPVDFRDLAVPIEVEAMLDARPFGVPKRVPAGVAEMRELALDPVELARDVFEELRGEPTLHVQVRRGSKVLLEAREKFMLKQAED